MNKFLLVDDHSVVRSGIKGLLSEIFKPAKIDEAGSGDNAVEQLKLSQYDLVMMDVQMPNTDTLGLVEYINTRFPDTKILMFSMSPENIYAKRFLKAGAKGFLSKEAPLEEISSAINKVLSNRKYISSSLAEILANDTFDDKAENPFNRLSRREFEIISLFLSGQTLSDISKSLNLQTSTVGTHKTRAFEKLGVSNILELKELANSYDL